MTKYIYDLHVIIPSQIAANVSNAAYLICPDIGPNNINIPLNELGDSADANHYGFSAPVTQQHVDALVAAGLTNNPAIIWARTDRSGMLIKRYDDESPESVLFTFDDLLNENNLKLRTQDSIY